VAIKASLYLGRDAWTPGSSSLLDDDEVHLHSASFPREGNQVIGSPHTSNGRSWPSNSDAALLNPGKDSLSCPAFHLHATRRHPSLSRLLQTLFLPTRKSGDTLRAWKIPSFH
jgi:hypothetical protein